MNKTATTNDAGTLVFDYRLEAYVSFFDTEWAKNLFSLTVNTQLDQPSFDLCTDWKGAANTFRMPWLLMFSLEHFQQGVMQGHEPFYHKLAKALRDHLLQGVGTTLSNMKRKEIVSIVDKLSKQVQEEIKKTPLPFPINELWRDYLTSPEFALSIWSSQRLCYGAVYFAYENFLRRCVEVVKPGMFYRPATSKLKDDLNAVLGARFGDLVLYDPSIETARLVRHTLSHNGGRATPEIKARSTGLTIQNEVIQIMPDDTRRLYDLLKTRVTLVVEKAVMLPDFRA